MRISARTTSSASTIPTAGSNARTARRRFDSGASGNAGMERQASARASWHDGPRVRSAISRRGTLATLRLHRIVAAFGQRARMALGDEALDVRLGTRERGQAGQHLALRLARRFVARAMAIDPLARPVERELLGFLGIGEARPDQARAFDAPVVLRNLGPRAIHQVLHRLRNAADRIAAILVDLRFGRGEARRRHAHGAAPSTAHRAPRTTDRRLRRPAARSSTHPRPPKRLPERPAIATTRGSARTRRASDRCRARAGTARGTAGSGGGGIYANVRPLNWVSTSIICSSVPDASHS